MGGGPIEFNDGGNHPGSQTKIMENDTNSNAETMDQRVARLSPEKRRVLEQFLVPSLMTDGAVEPAAQRSEVRRRRA